MIGAAARRILLVEDEPALLGLLGRYLRRVGYAVTECRSAHEALDAAQAGHDIAVVDLTLPDMPGEVLGDHLWQLHPDLPILFVSGRPATLPSGKPAKFLQKPFLPAALRDELTALVAATGPQSSLE